MIQEFLPIARTVYALSNLKIISFVNGLKKRPILSAFTATATEEVKNDIACILNLISPKIEIILGVEKRFFIFVNILWDKGCDFFVGRR